MNTFIDSSTYRFIQLCALWWYLRLVFGGTVEPEASNVTVISGKMLEISWTVSPASGETVNSLSVSVLPNTTVTVLDGFIPFPQTHAIILFGVGRLSATFVEPTYKLMLKNVSYTDKVTFQLLAIFTDGDKFDGKRSNIQVTVNGSPGICGNSFKSGYNIIETAILTVTQDICGHPKPIVKWKLEEDNTFSGSFSSVLIDNASRKYRYSFATRNIIRSDCGKKIMYNARNEFGKVEGNSTIYISFKPSKITLTSSYRHNASCVYLTWHKENTGNCLMDYHLKFDDKDDVYVTFKTNFSLCHSPCASSASVWASYKGNVGYKNNISLRSIPTRLDTTIMPSSRTTTEGTAAQIEDDCKCASKNAISIVITIVIGLILNIVIFVILKHKGFIVFNRNPKKTLQHTERRDDDNYEVTETTSSHYADLNVKSVKPSIYADLTTDSSKEYAEIELNETKQNKYANINT